MTDQDNDQSAGQVGPAIEALRAEIRSLREQNEQLTRQAESLAHANARAAQTIAQLEIVRIDSDKQMTKPQAADQQPCDLDAKTDPNIQRRNAELASANELMRRRIAPHEKAEQDQARLLAKLQSVNDELKDFAYIISHDLKAPLRGIKTLANWIATDYGDKLGDEGKEQITLLLNRVDRMAALIDGVLQYSRVGRVREEMVRVDLNELLPSVIDILAPPDAIKITVEGDLPTITCERTRISQVFQNLLGNAVKHMDKPQGRVTVTCTQNDGFWKFAVADNGPGIDPKHFERIFKIFQTLAPKDQSESTGVGLTLVKKIVELYGGKVWVESEIAKGSTFYFTLPTSSELQPEDQLTVAQVSQDQETTVGDHPKRRDST